MAQTKTFDWTGGVQTWRVPPGVTSVTIDAFGGWGGMPYTTASGKPGRAQGTLAVTPGETLWVYVAGRGSVGRNAAGQMLGGFGGGGNGGTGVTYPGFDGAGGGGASDVRQGGTALANRKIVAAGGGGRTGNATTPVGGSGGGTSGTAGGGTDGGGAGTPSAGGAYGSGGGGGGTGGALGVGGRGGNNTIGSKSGGGGGGGGYYGGGGGALDAGTGNNASTGGGGSSYIGGVTGGSTTTGYSTPGNVFNGRVMLTYNIIPNFATQSSPTAGVYTDQTAATVLSWVFSDNDPGDFQTAVDIRYRPVGSGSWTTVTTAVSGSGSTYSITAATLTAATQYEWQIQTYDSASAASGWSPSALFMPVVSPSAPTITAPGLASTLTADPTVFTWTPSGTQNAYQLQVCGDTAGTINPAVVYYDTGTVQSTTSSANADVTPPGNAVTVHVRVRTFTYANVWSPWTERGAQLVNLSPPGVPTVVLAPDLTYGRISVAITNPATPNATVYNNIYRTVGNQPETLWSAQVDPNVTVYDPLAPFGYTIRYRVVAFSAAGGQTSST
jgi:hypothetical protein